MDFFESLEYNVIKYFGVQLSGDADMRLMMSLYDSIMAIQEKESK